MLSKTNNPGKNYAVRIAALVLMIMTSLVICMQAQKSLQKSAITDNFTLLKDATKIKTKDSLKVTCDKIIITDEKVLTFYGNVHVDFSNFNKSNYIIYINNKLASIEAIQPFEATSIGLLNSKSSDDDATILEFFTKDFIMQNNIKEPKQFVPKKEIDNIKTSTIVVESIALSGTNSISATLNNNLKKEKNVAPKTDKQINIIGEITLVELQENTEKNTVKPTNINSNIIVNGNIVIEEPLKTSMVLNDSSSTKIRIAEKVVKPSIEIRKVNEYGNEFSKKGINNVTMTATENNLKISSIPKVYNGFVKSKKDISKSLVIIDGVEIKYETLKEMNPENIKTISILDGKSGKTLYGEKGSEGVIIITTKKQIFERSYIPKKDNC